MAVGEIISVARYNAMQAKIASVLGNGAANFGYGQPVASSPVSTVNTVNAAHMQNLKLDMVDVRVHQTGADTPSITSVITNEEITDVVYVEYETIINTLYNNRLTIYELTQSSTENKLSSTRTTDWGGNTQPQSVFHEFTVTFASADSRRHFFNSGGEVRFAASLTSGSGAKYTEWSSMLSAMGTVKFNYTTVTASSGTGLGIGNYDLTTAYQTVFVKSGSGVYADNDYIIKAKEVSSSVISFLVEFNDGATGSGGGGFGPVDDPVNGTLTSSISQLRATGAYVEVPTPGYQNTQNLI
jgi:hypothetical protein